MRAPPRLTRRARDGDLLERGRGAAGHKVWAILMHQHTQILVPKTIIRGLTWITLLVASRRRGPAHARSGSRTDSKAALGAAIASLVGLHATCRLQHEAHAPAPMAGRRVSFPGPVDQLSARRHPPPPLPVRSPAPPLPVPAFAPLSASRTALTPFRPPRAWLPAPAPCRFLALVVEPAKRSSRATSTLRSLACACA